MIYFLLGLSVLTASGKALFGKALGLRSSSLKKSLFNNFQAFAVSLIFSLVLTAPKLSGFFSVSPYSVILALIFAISTTVTQITQSKAMSLGPSSLVSLVYSFGFTVPIIYGLFVWHENVSVFQYVGLVLLIVAIVLIVGKKEKAEKRGHIWFWLALVAMLGSGTNGIIQKTHQTSAFSGEFELFLVYVMLFSTVITGLAALIVKDKNTERDGNGSLPLWKKTVPPIGLGLCVCVLNFVNLFLSGKLPTIIMFPIYNVGNLLVTTVISAIIFKDKTTMIQNIGLCVGVIAILVIGLL